MGPLAGVIEKIHRVDELTQDLEQLCLNYSMYDVSNELILRQNRSIVPDRELNAYRITMELPPVPLRIAVLFGEIMHHLRSCLDHVAHVLVWSSGKQPREGAGGTAFPVRQTLDKGPARVQPAVWDEAASFVESIQPYSDPERRGTEHPLQQITDLNNVDKHRLLHVVAVAGGGMVTFRPAADADQPLTEDAKRYPVRLLSGREQVVRVDEPVLDDVQMGGMWTHVVALGEGDGSWRLGVDGLARQLRNFVVQEVLHPIEPIILRRLRSAELEPPGA